MDFNIEDKVEVLDDSLKGVVKSISGNLIMIETSEGFEMEFDASELVKIEGNQGKLIASQNIPFSEILKEKQDSKKRKSIRVKPKERNAPPMEVDLHIEKLVNSHKGMNNFDILTLQTETAKRQIEFAIRKRIQKIVFIHGVGEGVLKTELEYLFSRYENLKYYDADYQKYGVGATEVYIFQNT